MWLLLVILLLLAIFLYPTCLVAYERKRAVAHIEKTLQKTGGKLTVLKKSYVLSSNRAAEYDLLIETEDTQYAVKFWSAKRRNLDLLISSEGAVAEQRIDRDPLAPQKDVRQRVLRTHFYRVPKTGCNFTQTEGKRQVRLLLVYPSYRQILAYYRMEWTPLHSGDCTMEKIICTPSSLTAMLQKENKNV